MPGQPSYLEVIEAAAARLDCPTHREVHMSADTSDMTPHEPLADYCDVRAESADAAMAGIWRSIATRLRSMSMALAKTPASLKGALELLRMQSAEIARLREALQEAGKPIASPADLPTDPAKRAVYWMEIAQRRATAAREALDQ